MIGSDLGSAQWPSRQGPLWRERPRKGEGRWWILACTTSPSPVPHQRQKYGGRSLHFLPLPCGATTRRARGWTRDAGAPRGFTPQDLGNPCQPASNAGFPGTAWTTTARASPSESGALGLLKGRATSCATSVRHPPFVRWSPIRRHGRDPRRRKLSIHRAPTGTTMAFDGGPITSASVAPSGTAPQHPLIAPPEPDQTAFLPHHVQDAGDGVALDLGVICRLPEGFYWRRTPLLDRLRGPFQCGVPLNGAHGLLLGFRC